jgi:Ca-activated chloride channel family protein
MTVHIGQMTEGELAECATADPDAGLGVVWTERGELTQDAVTVRVVITGLVSMTDVVQRCHNPYPVEVDAAYVVPVPDRAAVTGLRMSAPGRTVEATLLRRAAAGRAEKDGPPGGASAGVTEPDPAEGGWPDVVTIPLGRIEPGETIEVSLGLVAPLSYEDGQVTYRCPFGIGPPAGPAPRPAAATSYRVEVDLDPGGLPLGLVRASLALETGPDGVARLAPGAAPDRDLVVRAAYGDVREVTSALVLDRDTGLEHDGGGEGTFAVTVLPPTGPRGGRPRDVVVLLDRSGSMSGWKMVAARRAAARVVDILGPADRFAVLVFDHTVAYLPEGRPQLAWATDRWRRRAARRLARVEADGGTELSVPLHEGLQLLSTSDRDQERVLILITDGQVGDEDRILESCADLLAGVRVHTVGVDQSVNAGLLGRLAAAGGGRCELVESEDRLDEAMTRIHRRIASPLVTGLALRADRLGVVAGSVAPCRLPDLFPGVPLVVTGRFRGPGLVESVRMVGTTRDARAWVAEVRPAAPGRARSALTALWAQTHLGDLEDSYLSLDPEYAPITDDFRLEELRHQVEEDSLRYGVVGRFTAWAAVRTHVEADGTRTRRVLRPVRLPAAAYAATAYGGAAPPSPDSPAPPVVTPAAPGPPASVLAAATRRTPLTEPSGAVALTGPPEIASVELAAARAQAGAEAHRLRASAGLGEGERRDLLSDLGSRLEALVRHLRGHGVAEVALARMIRLAESLANDRPLRADPQAFASLWAAALATLEDFGPGAAPTPSPAS